MSMHQRSVLGRLRDRMNRTMTRYVLERDIDPETRQRQVGMRTKMWANDKRHAKAMHDAFPTFQVRAIFGRRRPRMVRQGRSMFATDEEYTAYVRSGGSDGSADRATDHQQAGTGTDHRRGAE